VAPFTTAGEQEQAAPFTIEAAAAKVVTFTTAGALAKVAPFTTATRASGAICSSINSQVVDDNLL
jgi:hypothetical protein